MELVAKFFFFSSRRRHTRCSRDWSSDVCSSDLHHSPFCRQLSTRKQSGLRHSKPAQQSSLRSEEHTSELQSRLHLVCRLLLEKKKKKKKNQKMPKKKSKKNKNQQPRISIPSTAT